LQSSSLFPELKPRYNIAPQTDITVVRDGECVLLRWGLVPFWAKAPKLAYSMINAKAESLADKPSYREAFKRRCCLIPATASTGGRSWPAASSRATPASPTNSSSS